MIYSRNKITEIICINNITFRIFRQNMCADAVFEDLRGDAGSANQIQSFTGMYSCQGQVNFVTIKKNTFTCRIVKQIHFADH